MIKANVKSIKVQFTLALDTYFRISLVEEDSVFSLSTLSGLDQQYPPPFFCKKAYNRYILFDIHVYEVFLYRFKAFGYTLCQWCEELMEQLLKIQYLALLTAKNIVLF